MDAGVCALLRMGTSLSAQPLDLGEPSYQVAGGKTVSLSSPGYLLLGLANSTNLALGTRI